MAGLSLGSFFIYTFLIRGMSFNGRTAVSKTANSGSNPGIPASQDSYML